MLADLATLEFRDTVATNSASNTDPVVASEHLSDSLENFRLPPKPPALLASARYAVEVSQREPMSRRMRNAIQTLELAIEREHATKLRVIGCRKRAGAFEKYDRTEIAALASQGKSASAIAIATGAHVSTVYEILRQIQDAAKFG